MSKGVRACVFEDASNLLRVVVKMAEHVPVTVDLKVAKVSGQANLEVGWERVGLALPLTLGRSASADVTLPEPTVAREHVRLESSPRGLLVSCLSERGSTFLDRVRAQPGVQHEVTTSPCYIQLGRLLLRVRWEVSTIPFDNALSLPAVTRGPTSWVELHGPAPMWVRVGGARVSLFPSATRVLCELLKTPGEVVAREVLEAAMGDAKAGGNNLVQAITYIRDMFEAALKDGDLTLSDLRDRIARSAATPLPQGLEEMPRRGLLRTLVENVRGVGYRVRLSPSDVDVTWS